MHNVSGVPIWSVETRGQCPWGQKTPPALFGWRVANTQNKPRYLIIVSNLQPPRFCAVAFFRKKGQKMKKIFVSVCGLLISVSAIAANQKDINVMRNYYKNYDNCVYERGIKYCDRLFASTAPEYEQNDNDYGYVPQSPNYYQQPYSNQTSSDVNGFVGGSVGYAMADYDDDNLDGMPDGFCGFGINAGLRFFGRQQTYNPGISVFYDYFMESDGDDITISDGYNNVTVGLAAKGHAFGGMFDNYINDASGNSAFFFGLGYSQINTEVSVKAKNHVEGVGIKVSGDENYKSFVAHIGFVIDVAEHVGLTISDKIYIPESDSGISFVNIFSLGARLTF